MTVSVFLIQTKIPENASPEQAKVFSKVKRWLYVFRKFGSSFSLEIWVSWMFKMAVDVLGLNLFDLFCQCNWGYAYILNHLCSSDKYRPPLEIRFFLITYYFCCISLQYFARFYLGEDKMMVVTRFFEILSLGCLNHLPPVVSNLVFSLLGSLPRCV